MTPTKNTAMHRVGDEYRYTTVMRIPTRHMLKIMSNQSRFSCSSTTMLGNLRAGAAAAAPAATGAAAGAACAVPSCCTPAAAVAVVAVAVGALEDALALAPDAPAAGELAGDGTGLGIVG